MNNVLDQVAAECGPENIDLGHDPRNHVGRLFEWSPPYDADFCTCDLWAPCKVHHPMFKPVPRWRGR